MGKSEASVALNKENPSIFIALDGKKIVGFACYNATGKGYFGPLGVDPAYEKMNIGINLYQSCLKSLKDEGYGYAIIGLVEEHNVKFYEKSSKLIRVESNNSIYSRLPR